MSQWQEIRELARSRHAEVSARANGDASSTALIAAAADLTGIPWEALPAGDALPGPPARLPLHGATAQHRQVASEPVGGLISALFGQLRLSN